MVLRETPHLSLHTCTPQGPAHTSLHDRARLCGLVPHKASTNEVHSQHQYQ